MSGTETQTRDDDTTAAEDTQDTQAQDLLADAVEDQQQEDANADTSGGDSGTGDDASTTAKPAAAKPAETGKADNRVDRAELNKVIKERQDAKKQLRDAQKELDDLKRANENETERAQREVREQTTAEIEGKYKPLVVRTSAEAALVAAGVAAGEDDKDARKKKIDRMVRLMNLNDIEVTKDGEVEGLDSQINQLKEDYPELFITQQPEPPRRKTVGAKAADGADKPAPKKKLSAAEQMMKQFRGEK